jgi:hypothetical protein
VAKFSEYVNEISFVDPRVSLSYQLIDPIEACVIEVMTLPSHTFASRASHDPEHPIHVLGINKFCPHYVSGPKLGLCAPSLRSAIIGVIVIG